MNRTRTAALAISAVAATALIGLAGPASASTAGAYTGTTVSSGHILAGPAAPRPPAPAPRVNNPAPPPAPRVNPAPPQYPTSRGGQVAPPPKNAGNGGAAPGSRVVTKPAPVLSGGKSYTTRASNGQTYTYNYNRNTYHNYYSTYHGGYPVFGTLLYFQLLADPFYGPNYFNPASQYYGDAYPAGYRYVNGELVPVEHHFWRNFFIVALVIVAVLGVLYWLFGRSTSSRARRRSYDF